MKSIGSYCFVTFLIGCSVGCGGVAPRLSPSGRSDPVSMTRSTRSLVAPARQLVAYVPAAARLSIIDQASATEVYGIDFEADVRAAFPVANFDGVAALTAGGLTLFSGGLTRSFAFEGPGDQWDAATDGAAFAFSGPKGVRVIRHLGGDSWQDEDLPGNASLRNTVPMLNSDGTALVTVHPETGSYAVYRADQSRLPMSLRVSCPTDEVRSAPIVALATIGTRILWGDAQGGLGTIEVNSDGCSKIVTSATLSSKSDVARLVPRSEQSILVFGIGGRVFDWDGRSNLVAYMTLNSCDFPLAPVPLGDDDLASLCLNGLDTRTDARTVVYQSASYNFFNKTQSRPIQNHGLSLDDVATVGLDAPSRRLLILSKSALGRLVVVDLPTGQTQEKRGLFLKRVLER